MFAQLNERHITKSKVRKYRETLKLFDKREQINEFKVIKNDLEEVHFCNETLEIKTKGDKLYIEERSFAKISSDFIMNYELDYIKIKFCEIELYIVEEENKKLKLPFVGIARQNKIFTENDEGTIQHELQHCFENLLGISYLFNSWEREYTAYLTEMIFSNSKEGLDSIYNEVLRNNWNDETEKYYDNEVHYKARLQIVSDLLDLWVDKKSSEEQIKQVALILLDRIYKKKTGMSYEEIMNEVKK